MQSVAHRLFEPGTYLIIFEGESFEVLPIAEDELKVLFIRSYFSDLCLG